MRTADYIDILNGTALRCGISLDEASGDEFTALRGLLSDRLSTFWDHHFWPALLRIQKRYFRLLWNSADSYAAPSLTAAVERYYAPEQKYYQTLRAVPANNPPAIAGATNLDYWAECQSVETAEDYDAAKTYVKGEKAYWADTDRVYQLYVATSTGNAPTDATRWGVLTDFNRYVAYEQTGKDAFDICLNVWDQDPRLVRNAQRIPNGRSELGVQILAEAAYAWLQIRLRTPVLTGDPFSTAAGYASGGQAFFKSDPTFRGNFYTSTQATNAGESPATHPAKWSLVEIPLIARKYLIHGAAADWLRPEGDDEESDRQELLAQAALQEQVTLNTGGQGLTEETCVGAR